MCNEVLFSKLILILKEEMAVSVRIKELLDKEKEYLVQGKMEEFEEIVALKEAAVRELDNLEKQRLKFITELRNNLQLDSPDTTLKPLLKKASPLHQKILTEIRLQYRALMDEIKAANQRNNLLLQSSIKYVEYTLNLVTRGQEGTYGKSGQKYYAERKLVNRTI